MTRHSYSDTAVPTQLTALLNSSGLVAQVASTAGYPDPTTGPFVVTLERDTIREEKILCSAIVGLSVTISQRGYGGTTAQDHSIGATFEHTWSGTEADEVNKHANTSNQAHGLGPSDGSFVGTTKTQTLTGKTMSGNDNVFTDIPATASPEITDLLDAEAVARDAADDAEAAARIAGDENEADNRDAAIAAEAALRDTAIANAAPCGSIIMYGGAVAPSGFLVCDGSQVPRATYPLLFSRLGTTFGPGDGSSTFNLPDLRTRLPRGVGTSYSLAQTGGANLTTLAVTNLPGHTHTINHGHADTFAISSGGAHTHGTTAADVISGTTGTNDFEADPPGENRSFDIATISSGGSHTHGMTGGVSAVAQSSGSTGDATPADTQDPYIVLNFIIKAT